MTAVSDKNFGYLIAYLLPGFFVLIVLGSRSLMIRAWLGSSTALAPTVGGFLYVTLASVALGMLVSAVRWLLLDAVHHRTGIYEPRRDFSRLPGRLHEFEAAVHNHYRYYQFYGNSLFALLTALPSVGPLADWLSVSPAVVFAANLLIVVVLFLASRDALRKYYARTGTLLAISLPHQKGQNHDQWLASATSAEANKTRRQTAEKSGSAEAEAGERR